MALKYRYIGDGAFLPGVPARDLSELDLEDLTPEQRAELKAHMALEVRLYEAVSVKGAGQAPAAGEGSE